MFGFGRDRDEVNGFSDSTADTYRARDLASYNSHIASSSDLSSGHDNFLLPYRPTGERQVPIRPRKGKGKGKGDFGRAGGCTISTDDVPTHMPIRCAFCKEWGHHLTLCVKAFKDRLEKVETHCKHGFHKPWYHDGLECRCRYCGIHLRHLDRNA